MPADQRPVLILGAGINGAALARELVLNSVPVVIVDRADLASGTTAYSSRLIHGGLRYLEYGEFDLVRESLEERNLLLRLAADFVKPLRLFIPITNRFGGAMQQAARFLGIHTRGSQRRGLYVVRAGLWMYDRYAAEDVLPSHTIHRAKQRKIPQVQADDVHWLAAYSDAQIPNAERFTLALLRDAAAAAKERGVRFELHTYHETARIGDEFGLRPTGEENAPFTSFVAPAAVVNATGAWVDETLHSLKVPSSDLIGGTKGSHFITFHTDLRAALRGGGIYTEAADGRPIFVLPFGEGTLVGTTDIPFTGDPAEAVAAESEIEYLLTALRYVMPQIHLDRKHIAAHYCGVRRLPKIAAGAPAGITRRHLWHWHRESRVPMVSLIGGKLTTCRAFAEQTVRELLPKLSRTVESNSRERPLPEASYWNEKSNLIDRARESIRHEHVRHLGDLVERRLLLHLERELSYATLQKLAQLMVDEKKLAAIDLNLAVDTCVSRLRSHFGRGLS